MNDATDTAAAAPIWVRLPEAQRLTGLSRSKLYELLAAGAIRNASLRGPGQRHATRLVHRASLLAFIDEYASGGNAA